MNFHVDPAAFRERRVHDAQGKLGLVAIAAEMAEDDALDFSRQQFLDHAYRRRIRQVPVARLDPLFHRPRPMCIVLKKFFIMIRFDHERVHFAQSLDDHLRRVTEIGDETEPARSCVKGKSQRIDSVVRDGERLHCDVANRKLRTGPKNPPVRPESFRDSFEESVAPNCLSRERIAINRQIEFAAENFKSANVIAMFVREKHAI